MNQKIGAKNQVEQSITKCKKEIQRKKLHFIYAEEVLLIIQEVSRNTQQDFAEEISKLISMAMDYVLENPYKLEIDFVERRERTEADIYFIRNEERIKPLDSSGGGAVGVACFALQISFLFLWIKYVNPNIQKLLLLDEPLRCLSKSYLPQASALIRELSDTLGLQIIMVTHLEELSECVSKQIRIGQRNGISFFLSKKGGENNEQHEFIERTIKSTETIDKPNINQNTQSGRTPRRSRRTKHG